MSALASAFRAAGIESPADEKRRWCLEAWAQYPGKDQGNERREHVLRQFRPAQALFYEPSHTLMMIGKALNEVRHEIRDAAPAAGTGQNGQRRPDGQRQSHKCGGSRWRAPWNHRHPL